MLKVEGGFHIHFCINCPNRSCHFGNMQIPRVHCCEIYSNFCFQYVAGVELVRSWCEAAAELEFDVSFTTNKVRVKMGTVKYRQLSPLEKGKITRT